MKPFLGCALVIMQINTMMTDHERRSSSITKKGLTICEYAQPKHKAFISRLSIPNVKTHFSSSLKQHTVVSSAASASLFLAKN